MFAFGTKWTCRGHPAMSALRGKADMALRAVDLRLMTSSGISSHGLAWLLTHFSRRKFLL
jgi:hypothetical protein